MLSFKRSALILYFHSQLCYCDRLRCLQDSPIKLPVIAGEHCSRWLLKPTIKITAQTFFVTCYIIVSSFFISFLPSKASLHIFTIQYNFLLIMCWYLSEGPGIPNSTSQVRSHGIPSFSTDIACPHREEQSLL